MFNRLNNKKAGGGKKKRGLCVYKRHNNRKRPGFARAKV